MATPSGNTPLSGIPSTVSIRNSPLHPALVDFPIGLLTSAFVTDLLYALTRAPMWADFSFWLILAGWTSGLLAVLTGLIDFLTIARARSLSVGWLHFLAADFAIFLSAFNLLGRISDHQGQVLYAGLALSGIAMALLLLAGNLGGRLVFRYLIGVYGGTVPEERKGGDEECPPAA